MMRGAVTRTWVLGFVAGACLVGSGIAGAAVAHAIPPGTPAQVASAVAASTKITSLDAASEAQLALGTKDSPISTMPGTAACEGSTTPCTFGDVTSKRIVVLYGDSHAMMWIPAVSAAAARAKDRLVVFWKNTCPVASVANFRFEYSVLGNPPQCATYRHAVIPLIRALKPRAVILGERTTLVYSEPSDVLFTNAQWRAALITTIHKLQSRTTKVAVLEDLPWFTNNPRPCLAANPSSVQTCSEPYPNKAEPGLQVAEAGAAKATRSLIVRTHQWLCTPRRCSPVVHDMVTYLDQGHVDATYSRYLSVVVGTALATLLR
jgi:hypothetical protein